MTVALFAVAPYLNICSWFLVGISPPEFDKLTLAVIRGRLVRYLMRSKEVQFIFFAEEVDVSVSLFCRYVNISKCKMFTYR